MRAKGRGKIGGWHRFPFIIPATGGTTLVRASHYWYLSHLSPASDGRKSSTQDRALSIIIYSVEPLRLTDRFGWRCLLFHGAFLSSHKDYCH